MNRCPNQGGMDRGAGNAGIRPRLARYWRDGNDAGPTAVMQFGLRLVTIGPLYALAYRSLLHPSSGLTEMIVVNDTYS